MSIGPGARPRGARHEQLAHERLEQRPRRECGREQSARLADLEPVDPGRDAAGGTEAGLAWLEHARRQLRPVR